MFETFGSVGAKFSIVAEFASATVGELVNGLKFSNSIILLGWQKSIPYFLIFKTFFSELSRMFSDKHVREGLI